MAPKTLPDRVQLLIAPASGGKTAYAQQLARATALNLSAIPRILLASHQQARSWRRELAHAGGALGVRIFTFDQLYAECLQAAGEAYTLLSEPVRYRLIRSLVDDLPLVYYAPLTHRPGFVQVLSRLFTEWKAALALPQDLLLAAHTMHAQPQLVELFQIYAAYQERLQMEGWADRSGLGWLAVEALEERANWVAQDWPLLVVDGFAQFQPVELALLRLLTERSRATLITLAGDLSTEPRPMAHGLFLKTRQLLEGQLGVRAIALPKATEPQVPALAHLERCLFSGGAMRQDPGGALDLIEAPDRATEVRSALRWLKTCIVHEGIQAGETALLARNLGPYRHEILQTGHEFGLPLRLLGGLPLRTNPAIAALLDLLRLALPAGGESGPSLSRRLVVEAWKSPYFDWSALPSIGSPDAVGIVKGDSEDLDTIARWGRVIGGLSQWLEALDLLALRSGSGQNGSPSERERTLPASLLTGAQATALRHKFERFVERVTPPAQGTYKEFTGWLETMIGADPDLQDARFPISPESTSLQIVAQARAALPGTAERDVGALQAFKDVLRGLVWTEEALGLAQPLTFTTFFEELAGAIEAATFQIPPNQDKSEILVANAHQAHGVPFRAVALLGLAEGEFPATLGEDPFLRDSDREKLRELGIKLEPSLHSTETETFYQAVTRARLRLLLTRPRLAENGAVWPASPFWEEVVGLVSAKPLSLTSEARLAPPEVASWPELIETVASYPDLGTLLDWAAQIAPERIEGLKAASQVVGARHFSAAGSQYNGIFANPAAVAAKFGPDHVWSCSRLETYRRCPFSFFVGSVLGLEPRRVPTEGLDAAQLGNIYHHILEDLYQDPRVVDSTELDQLLAALPQVAASVLDEAPQREGFRRTVWWAQTRAEIESNVALSLQALAELPGDFVPHKHEAVFGLAGQPCLVVHAPGDQFRLRGYIDRIDRAPDDRLRVIDYKTGGPSPFSKPAVRQGKKLQLPLYALAARDALGLGEPVEGFYWHVQQAQHSPFTLAKFDDGPQGAMETALTFAWQAVRGARVGHFAPYPPGEGCPGYCPAIAFCWRYRAAYWG